MAVSDGKNTVQHVSREVRIILFIAVLLLAFDTPCQRFRSLWMLQNGLRYKPGVFYYEIRGWQLKSLPALPAGLDFGDYGWAAGGA
jgi:hypothetical protein